MPGGSCVSIAPPERLQSASCVRVLVAGNVILSDLFLPRHLLARTHESALAEGLALRRA